MRDLFDKEFQQEMDDFFEELDNVVTLVHEVNGEVVTDSVQDVLERENMVDDEEVDVITDHLPEIEKCCTICEFSEPGDGCGANDLSELEQLEMEAELSVGV